MTSTTTQWKKSQQPLLRHQILNKKSGEQSIFESHGTTRLHALRVMMFHFLDKPCGLNLPFESSDEGPEPIHNNQKLCRRN